MTDDKRIAKNRIICSDLIDMIILAPPVSVTVSNVPVVVLLVVWVVLVVPVVGVVVVVLVPVPVAVPVVVTVPVVVV